MPHFEEVLDQLRTETRAVAKRVEAIEKLEGKPLAKLLETVDDLAARLTRLEAHQPDSITPAKPAGRSTAKSAG